MTGAGMSLNCNWAAKVALIRLTDDWGVRKRYILMWNQAALPTYATDMVAALFAYYQKP